MCERSSVSMVGRVTETREQLYGGERRRHALADQSLISLIGSDVLGGVDVSHLGT